MVAPYLIGGPGPGAWRGSAGEGDPGFPEPPVVLDVNGDVTINGKVKPGSFGKFVYPLATVQANRVYVFRVVANFSQLAKQGKLAMVGFGFKSGNDFHIAGLRGDGSTGTNAYIVHGTPPNGWNKETGHTTVDGGAASAGTQHTAYYKLVTTAANGAYTLSTSTDGVAYTEIFVGQATTPFSTFASITTFGIALWFNNTDAGPFSVNITSFSDTAGASFIGASVKKASDLTAADFSAGYTALSWDVENFDTDGFHAGGSPTRLTIPAHLNGYYVIVAAHIQFDNVTANLSVSSSITKNGGAFDGMSGYMRDNGAGVDNSAARAYQAVRSHPVQVSSGDYFEVSVHVATDSSVTIEADTSFFSIHVIGPSIQGALVKNGSNKTTQNYSAGAAILTYDTDVYDSDAFHDTGSNTGRLTVPLAYNGRYALLHGTHRMSSVNVDQAGNHYIAKNGVGNFWLGNGMQDGRNGDDLNHWMDSLSCPHVVATGDYFEQIAFCQDSSVTLDAVGTYFSIQILPSTFQGVGCKLNADATANYTTPTALAWDGTDVFDTDAAHDPASNNTKIIVPSAWNGKYGILIANLRGSSLTAGNSASISIQKGGVVVGGVGGHMGNSTGVLNGCYTSPILLTTGDEFTCVYWNSSDTSSTIRSAESMFALYILN